MTDSKSELMKDNAGGNRPKMRELDEPPPDETPDDGRKGGADGKSKALGGSPGVGGYGRPNRQATSD